jgi:hypothetical protein
MTDDHWFPLGQVVHTWPDKKVGTIVRLYPHTRTRYPQYSVQIDKYRFVYDEVQLRRVVTERFEGDV